MTDPEEDFAALFEASLKARRFEKGQTIDGIVVSIGPEVAFVDVGGKGEASIDIDEMKDPDGNLEVAVGDRIQAVVVSTAGGLTLSRSLPAARRRSASSKTRSRVAYPVEGKVERAVKGGFEVTIARQRAFCPVLPDRHPPHRARGARRAGLRIPDRRVQGRAGTSSCPGACCSRRSSGRLRTRSGNRSWRAP